MIRPSDTFKQIPDLPDYRVSLDGRVTGVEQRVLILQDKKRIGIRRQSFLVEDLIQHAWLGKPLTDCAGEAARPFTPVWLRRSKRVARGDTGQEYDNARLASEATGADGGGIRRCCIGAQKTAGGIAWSYVVVPGGSS